MAEMGRTRAPHGVCTELGCQYVACGKQLARLETDVAALRGVMTLTADHLETLAVALHETNVEMGGAPVRAADVVRGVVRTLRVWGEVDA